jgi:hypothetical protein
MKTQMPTLRLFALAIVLGACSKATPPLAPPAAPQAIKPDGAEIVVAKAFATGSQVYECRDAKWTLSGPDAELKDERGTRIGRHFAGPTWELSDGSKVVAEVVQRADAPVPDAVPWLLLRAKTVEGKGALDRITFIQRVDTVGGRAPAAPCSAEPRLAVPYSATYYFYAHQA